MSVVMMPIMVHNNEIPFFCKVCNKSFAWKGNSKKHLVIPNQEKTCFYALFVVNHVFKSPV